MHEQNKIEKLISDLGTGTFLAVCRNVFSERIDKFSALNRKLLTAEIAIELNKLSEKWDKL